MNEQSISEEEAIKQVQEWAKSGDLSKAVQGCREILAVDPANPEVLALLHEYENQINLPTPTAPVTTVTAQPEEVIQTQPIPEQPAATAAPIPPTMSDPLKEDSSFSLEGHEPIDFPLDDMTSTNAVNTSDNHSRSKSFAIVILLLSVLAGGGYFAFDYFFKSEKPIQEPPAEVIGGYSPSATPIPSPSATATISTPTPEAIPETSPLPIAGESSNPVSSPTSSPESDPQTNTSPTPSPDNSGKVKVELSF